MLKSIESRKVINEFLSNLQETIEKYGDNPTEFYFRIHGSISETAEQLEFIEEQ